VKVWLDGALVEAAEAKVSALDRGFLFGDGIYETLRAYPRGLFLAREHLRRLQANAAAVELALPPEGLLQEAMAQVLQANALQGRDARVRITVTRGAGAPGELWPAQPGEPTVLVTAQPFAVPEGLLEQGARAIVATRRVASGAPHVKSTSFQEHVLAKAEARRAGAWEALLLNDRGEVAEGATSNLFVLDEDGALRTPPPEAGILRGLTRAVVLRFAQPALCLATAEAPVTLDQLRGAREAFLTSSTFGVVPLVRVDGHSLGDGAPGPVTQAVVGAYRAEVARALDP
jgi:branched-chain amino acid aminotransferase